MGISFTCPHCSAAVGSRQRLAIAFDNPVDGGAPYSFPGYLLWRRDGDEFETLSLWPSVDASNSGHWRGFIKNGEMC